MKKIYIKIPTFIIALLFVLSSCESNGGETEQQSREPEVQITQTVTDSAGETDNENYTNPLTGEKISVSLSDKKTVALMVKNDKAASPQPGLSEADIVYEAPVEGGLTRFVALYADIDGFDDIAPIIDSRFYFYTLASSHDAVFVQAGTTSHSRTLFAQNGITPTDALAGQLTPTFRRDSVLEKERGPENSITTNGKSLNYSVGAFEKKASEGHENSLIFAKNSSADKGIACSAVTVPYSSFHTPYFKYSTLNDAYMRYQYGDEHTDGRTGEQLGYKNLVIMFAESDTVDGSGELEFELYGEGDGYYVNSGKYVQILWRRYEGDVLRFYETNGSKEIVFEVGNTFISVCSNSMKTKVELV